jgi:hypothetical protein
MSKGAGDSSLSARIRRSASEIAVSSSVLTPAQSDILRQLRIELTQVFEALRVIGQQRVPRLNQLLTRHQLTPIRADALMQLAGTSAPAEQAS